MGALNSLPPMDKTNRTARLSKWSERRIRQERIGRVARLMKALEKYKDEMQKNKIADSPSDSSGGESDADKEDEDGEEDGEDGEAWSEGNIIMTAMDGDMDEWSTLGLSYQVRLHPSLVSSACSLKLWRGYGDADCRAPAARTVATATGAQPVYSHTAQRSVLHVEGAASAVPVYHCFHCACGRTWVSLYLPL